MYKGCIVADMTEETRPVDRTNIRLDEQARADARIIARHYNLVSTSAAVRFALREVARRIEEGGLSGGLSKDEEQTQK
jgi:Arc/MetJ family transcription regulator